MKTSFRIITELRHSIANLLHDWRQKLHLDIHSTMRKSSQNRGILTLIGGAEDKKHDKLVLKRVWEAANKTQKVLVIPTASSYSDELGREYRYIFEEIGAKKVHYLDIRRSEEADRPLHLELMNDADLVFFTGGDQVKLAKIFLGTKLYQLIKKRFLYENLHIAGTSAGAAVQSKTLIYDGDDFGFHKGSVKSCDGFGLLPNITIDTHFMNRNRIPRLAQFLASGESKKGLGVSEDTAMMIYPNDRAEVIGSGIAVLMNADRMNYTNYHDIKEHEFVAANNIRFSFLVHGCMFDFKTWNAIQERSLLTQTR
jgi:cyanophycinase